MNNGEKEYSKKVSFYDENFYKYLPDIIDEILLFLKSKNGNIPISMAYICYSLGFSHDEYRKVTLKLLKIICNEEKLSMDNCRRVLEEVRPSDKYGIVYDDESIQGIINIFSLHIPN
jgi:hypothetical protein